MPSERLQQIKDLSQSAVPRHVAIIMDGNGRWAEQRGLSRSEGHRAGMKSVREAVEGSIQAGVDVLTLFAFSDENWRRPTREIEFLWSLEQRARALGYSSAEIDAYVDNDAEKDRLEAIARQRLRDMGGVEGNWETYCAVGRTEISRGSQIGQLLR